MDNEINKYLRILLKISSVVVAMFGLYLLLVYIFPILGRVMAYIPKLFLPFIFAILIAILIEPVVNFFETRLRFKRILAVLTSLVLVIGGFYLYRIIADLRYHQAAYHPLQGDPVQCRFNDFSIYQ